MANVLGENVNDKSELAEAVNEFIFGIGEELLEKFWDNSVKFEQKRSVNSIVLLQIDETEVLGIIRSLKDKKSAEITK